MRSFIGEKYMRTAPISSNDLKLSSEKQKHSSLATATHIGGKSEESIKYLFLKMLTAVNVKLC
jgi:hypothetical protein